MSVTFLISPDPIALKLKYVQVQESLAPTVLRGMGRSWIPLNYTVYMVGLVFFGFLRFSLGPSTSAWAFEGYWFSGILPNRRAPRKAASKPINPKPQTLNPKP